jgi:hypothetical protein
MRKDLSECKNNVKEIIAHFEQSFQYRFTQFMGVYLQKTSELITTDTKFFRRKGDTHMA